MENVETAQNHTYYTEVVCSMRDGFHMQNLTTGECGSLNGCARIGKNVREAHLSQVPVGEAFLMCLRLPNVKYSHKSRDTKHQCVGCNRSHKALGQFVPQYIVPNCIYKSVNVPILKGYGLQCSTLTLCMCYQVEMKAMEHYGYIDERTRDHAIDVALKNGIAYREFCEFANRGKSPPETEPYPVIPCLTLDERKRYWDRFAYDNVIGKMYTDCDQTFRIRGTVPVSTGDINCFEIENAETGEKQKFKTSWTNLQLRLSNNGPRASESAPPRRPPRERKPLPPTFNKKRGRTTAGSHVPRKKKRVIVESSSESEGSDVEDEYEGSDSEEEPEWNSEDETDEDEVYDSDSNSTSGDDEDVLMSQTFVSREPVRRPTRSTRRVVSYTEDSDVECGDERMDRGCSKQSPITIASSSVSPVSVGEWLLSQDKKK